MAVLGGILINKKNMNFFIMPQVYIMQLNRGDSDVSYKNQKV